MDWNFIGTVIGFIAIAEGLLIFISVKRERILLLKFISDFLWCLNYICLGLPTGAILNVIGMARETVFSQRGKHKWADSPVWMVVFLFCTLISPMIEILTNGFSLPPLLPAIGSMIAVIGFWNRRPFLTRIFNIAAQIPWLLYNLLGNTINWTGVINCTIIFISAIIGTIREQIISRKAESETVSE